MGIGEWLAQGVTPGDALTFFGLMLAVLSLREEIKERRNTNLHSLTFAHRDLWIELGHPKYRRLRDPAAELQSEPITPEEHMGVIMAIQHLHAAYRSMRSGLVVKPRGIRLDIRNLFSNPLPLAVWKNVRDLQNDDFVAFVESCFDANADETSKPFFQRFFKP